ncbi:hypothetical protein PM082_019910 [Marasmius tenuissimus]|nr:hypothetical protein PM082_019910 [Marasmius tenuissimus]
MLVCTNSHDASYEYKDHTTWNASLSSEKHKCVPHRPGLPARKVFPAFTFEFCSLKGSTRPFKYSQTTVTTPTQLANHGTHYLSLTTPAGPFLPESGSRGQKKYIRYRGVPNSIKTGPQALVV